MLHGGHLWLTFAESLLFIGFTFEKKEGYGIEYHAPCHVGAPQRYFSICRCIGSEWNPQMSQIGLSQLCGGLALSVPAGTVFNWRVLLELKQLMRSDPVEKVKNT